MTEQHRTRTQRLEAEVARLTAELEQLRNLTRSFGHGLIHTADESPEHPTPEHP